MDYLEFQDKFELLGVHVFEVLPAYALALEVIQDVGKFHGQAANTDPRLHDGRQLIPHRVASKPRALVTRRDRAHVKRGAGSAIRVVEEREIIREGDYLLEANAEGPLSAHLVQAIMKGLCVIRRQVQDPKLRIQDGRTSALSPHILVKNVSGNLCHDTNARTHGRRPHRKGLESYRSSCRATCSGSRSPRVSTDVV